MPGPAHLLLVDDDERICRMLKRYLVQEGYSVALAHDGAGMWEQLDVKRPDLIILDLVLPDVDGISLARELRAKINIGIIMLTGKDDPVDAIVGLEVGADDYITKPFEIRVLLARIRSVLRRLPDASSASPEAESENRDENVLRFNGWQMNLNTYELNSPSGETSNLSDHEFRLLEILVQNPRRVMSRNSILQSLSKRDWMPEDRSVDVSIGKLRKVLEENPAQPRLIRTIRNVGYQFTGKVEKSKN